MKYSVILIAIFLSSILMAQAKSTWGYEDDGNTYKITEVTSDNGAKLHIQYSNPNELKNGLVWYVITCDTKQHLLYRFQTERWLFYVKKYTLTLEKIKEFENVTAYQLIFQYDPEDEENLDKYSLPETRKSKIDIKMIVWLSNDDKKDIYCGSFHSENMKKNMGYRQIYDENLIRMRAMSEKEYYDSVSDLYIYFIEDEIEKANEHLKEYGDSKSYTFKYARDILAVIRQFDHDLAERYINVINELRKTGHFYYTYHDDPDNFWQNKI